MKLWYTKTMIDYRKLFSFHLYLERYLKLSSKIIQETNIDFGIVIVIIFVGI